MIPGEIITSIGEIELNVGRPTIKLQVFNTGDRPIQVGSHYHFYEVNSALNFDREQARGMRLDIPSGTAVRFEPGDEKEVVLVPFVGSCQIYGFNGCIQGYLYDYDFNVFNNIKYILQKKCSTTQNLWKEADSNILESGKWILNSGVSPENKTKILDAFEETIKKATKYIYIFILGGINGEFKEKLKKIITQTTQSLTIRIFSGIPPEPLENYEKSDVSKMYKQLFESDSYTL